jgi:hypothetical protein
VDEEAGIPYSCPAQRRHSHNNDDVGRPHSSLGTLQQRRAQVRGPYLLQPSKWQVEEAGTGHFPIMDDKKEADGRLLLRFPS